MIRTVWTLPFFRRYISAVVAVAMTTSLVMGVGFAAPKKAHEISKRAGVSQPVAGTGGGDAGSPVADEPSEPMNDPGAVSGGDAGTSVPDGGSTVEATPKGSSEASKPDGSAKDGATTAVTRRVAKPKPASLAGASTQVAATNVAPEGDTSDGGSLPLCAGGLRIEPGRSGTFYHVFDYGGGHVAIRVTVNVYETPDGVVFDWSSDYPVNRVVAKGGPEGYNLYAYDPPVTSGTGLHSPATPNGKWSGLSYIDFCFAKPGCLAVWKFNDLDGDGKYDDREPFLQGWTFKLKKGDVLIKSVVTNSSGKADFGAVGPGTYTVTEDVEPSWHNTTPLPYEVTIASCSSQCIKIGNAQDKKAELKVKKFHDLDGDGCWDGDEPILGEGWTFRLWHDGVLVDSKTTGSSGMVTFAGLDPGDYQVSEDPVEGWFATTTLPKGVTLAKGDCKTVCIGNARSGGLTVIKFHDVDKDGCKDEGEALLEGWEFTLYDGTQPIATAVTDGEGEAHFTNLKPGSYTLNETLKQGWYATTALPVTVKIGEGCSARKCVGNNYDIVKTFKLTYVGLPEGAKLFAKYRINAGEWQKIELVGGPPAYTSGQVLVPYGATVHFEWILEYQGVETVLGTGCEVLTKDTENLFEYVARLEGMKYHDLNANGQRDESEPGLSGWTVKLQRLLGEDKWIDYASTTTGEGGHYEFNGPVPGIYRLVEVLQEGWVQSDAPEGTICVGDNTHCSDLNFGNYKLAMISGHKYNDLDGDGALDDGELGLEGWTIELRDAQGMVASSTVTGQGGAYSFSDLMPGKTYAVAEVLQPDWQQTGPTAKTYPVTTVSGVDASGKDFFNRLMTSTIVGSKFEDMNANGKKDEREPGLEDWTIKLQVSNGAGGWTDTTSTVTGDGGSFTFTDVASNQQYRIVEVAQEGWTQSAPAGGSFLVTPKPGEPEGPFDFGNWRNATITGSKFEDMNENGIWDHEGEPPEVGLGGWTIQLKNAEGNVVAETVTADDGSYSLQAPPGTYTLAEVLKELFKQTAPEGGVFNVTVVSGQTREGFDFGNVAVQTAIVFEKSADKTVARPGEIVTYKLKYTNNGNVDEPAPILIVDNYDERYITPVEIGDGVDDGTKITWTDDKAMAPGETRTITYTMRVHSDMPVGTTDIINVATLTPPSGEPQTDTWTVRVTVTEEEVTPPTGLEVGFLALLASLALAGAVALRFAARSEK